MFMQWLMSNSITAIMFCLLFVAVAIAFVFKPDIVKTLVKNVTHPFWGIGQIGDGIREVLAGFGAMEEGIGAIFDGYGTYIGQINAPSTYSGNGVAISIYPNLPQHAGQSMRDFALPMATAKLGEWGHQDTDGLRMLT